MGCLGDVDAGCCLVCLVAGLGDWVCIVGVFDVLVGSWFGLWCVICDCIDNTGLCSDIISP